MWNSAEDKNALYQQHRIIRGNIDKSFLIQPAASPETTNNPTGVFYAQERNGTDIINIGFYAPSAYANETMLLQKAVPQYLNYLVRKYGHCRFQMRITPQNEALVNACQQLFPANVEMVKETIGFDGRGTERKESHLKLNLENLIEWQPSIKLSPILQEIPKEQELLKWLVSENQA